MGRTSRRSSLALSERDESMMILGTGCAYWSRDERRRFEELWAIHGERITEDLRSRDQAPAMMLGEVDPERDRELMQEWRDKMDARYGPDSKQL